MDNATPDTAVTPMPLSAGRHTLEGLLCTLLAVLVDAGYFFSVKGYFHAIDDALTHHINTGQAMVSTLPLVYLLCACLLVAHGVFAFTLVKRGHIGGGTGLVRAL
jgi:hypothetical protein